MGGAVAGAPGAAGWALPGYDVEERIGAGATGEVWRARERASGRLVALKRLRCREVAQRDRLRREAALLAGVASPHLVRLRTVVTSGDGLVLVLDLAAGGSLAALLAARVRLTPGEAAAVAVPLARALADVHAAGLVHGDVSPANVLFTAAGRPLLSDLGAARLAGDGSPPAVSVPYADPAVLAGAEPGPAADVYGWAAVCHAALTGAPPYPGDDAGAVLAAVATGLRRPVGEEVPELAPGFADAVEAALAVDPAARPGAAALAEQVLAACPPARLRLAGASVPVSAVPTVQPGAPPLEPSPAGAGAPPGAEGWAGAGTWTGVAAPPGAPPVAPGVPPPLAARLSALRARARGSAGPGRWRGRPRPAAPAADAPGSGRRGAGRWAAVRRPPGGAGGAILAALAVLATFAGCIAAGVWWARSGATGAHQLRAMPAAPRTAASPRTGSSRTAAAARPSPLAGPATTAPSRLAATAAPASRFGDVLRRLDAARDAAFAAGDVAALRRVYAPGTSAYATDEAKLRALRAEGQHAEGLALRLDDVRVVPGAVGGPAPPGAGGRRAAERRVTLAVVDELPAYRIVDRTGRVVAEVSGRGRVRWRIVLRRTDTGWLIAAVGRPEPVGAGGP